MHTAVRRSDGSDQSLTIQGHHNREALKVLTEAYTVEDVEKRIEEN